MAWWKRALLRSAGRIQEFVEVGHRMDGLIGAWVLTCIGVLDPTEWLRFQDNPRGAAFFEVVRDLHPPTLRAAVFGTKLDFSVRLIASDGHAAHVHVHCANIERADGSQVLQNSRADGVIVVRLFFAGAQPEERDR